MAYVRTRSMTRIAVSNPAEGMYVRLLCDKLITRLEESYRVCVCLFVFDIEPQQRGILGPTGAIAPQEIKK